jgi:PiT family inorganic phosphate transporter
MDPLVLVFLSSGLFLGWSLGANDAANVFGTAVGSRMIRFATAALICSVCLALGAVVSGAGAAHGLGKLGAVNALAGSFVVACSAALTVYWMTKAMLPVSTTQAIVGAIIGWNLFTGSHTDLGALAKIVGTWVACPILGAIFSALIYALVRWLIYRTRIHVLRLDSYTRLGLILAGAFGAYSLGANNIGNVMGVFVASSPFTNFSVAGLFTLSSVHQLFLLGAIAIGVGVFTYSRRVMMTVGSNLMPLNPVAAWVVVVSHSIVLFLFSSTGLEHFLVSHGLPPIPLIPVSSSQAVIGAVVGIGLLHGTRGARQIRWRVLLKIASGWVSTPLIAALVSFVMLFFVQNVFDQQVCRPVHYVLSPEVIARLEAAGVSAPFPAEVRGRRIRGGVRFRKAVAKATGLDGDRVELVASFAEVHPLRIDADACAALDARLLAPEQIEAVKALVGQVFAHKWQLRDALASRSAAWRAKPATPLNKAYNQRLRESLDTLYRTFHAPEQPDSPPASQP